MEQDERDQRDRRDRRGEADDVEVREPDNSTVDDWLGQRVDRDTARAERLLQETGDPDEAERAWEAGAEKHRPEDLPTQSRPAYGRQG